MRTAIARALVAVVLAGAPAYALMPRWRATVVAAAGLVLVAAVVARLGRWLGAARPEGPSAFERARRPAEASSRRPPDLEALERTLSWGTYSESDFDHRVRPLLRRLVAHRLREGHGVDLEADPARARALLTPALRRLEERGARAGDARVRTADIASLLDEIEAL